MIGQLLVKNSHHSIATQFNALEVPFKKASAEKTLTNKYETRFGNRGNSLSIGATNAGTIIKAHNNGTFIKIGENLISTLLYGIVT